MTLKLDSRLAAAADFVRLGSIVADIGADHGYLVCDLVRRGVCPKGIACDINEGPLDRCRQTVEEQGLGNQIEVRLSDGLCAVASDEADDIVIAGMGGDLIARILLETPWTRDRDKRFILQPMTKAEHLRSALCRAGYAICGEKAVQSGSFVYTVMLVQYMGKQEDKGELFHWTGLLLDRKDALSRKYLYKVCKTLEKKAEGLKTKAPEEAARYRTLVTTILSRMEDTVC